jgi:hypothetical protein
VAGIQPSAALRELEQMEPLGLVVLERVGNAKVVRANESSPHGALLRELLADTGRKEPEHAGPAPSRVRAWLASYGAPLVVDPGERVSRRPPLEQVLAEGLRVADSDAEVARTLPVVLWLSRSTLDLPDLVHRATRLNERRALGFFLELTGVLAVSRAFADVLEELRDRRFSKPTFFFPEAKQGRLAQKAAAENTPAVAKRWSFLMNMPLESFASHFRRFTGSADEVRSS